MIRDGSWQSARQLVSSDGAALPGMAEALLLREMADRTGSRNLHHRRKVWNQPDWIRFLRGGDHTAGGVSYPAAHPDLLVVGFCDETAGRLQEMDRMECCRGEVMKTSGCMSHRQEPSITGEYSCTHLELSIRSVAEAEIAALRNENGEAYRKCMQCRYAENAFGRLYITNQGDCYHKDLGCSGIKRTVRMIRLSEVGTRRPCSQCGQ